MLGRKIISIIVGISMGILWNTVTHAKYLVFSDVPKSHWAYDIIYELTSNGVIDGMGDGTFEPDGIVTREQFMKLLVCALDYEDESVSELYIRDVEADRWSAPYIYAGMSRGIYDTNESGSDFYPEIGLKRGISAEWIVNGLGIAVEPENVFSDVKSYDKQYSAIAAAEKIGIVSGYEDNTFRAENTITRAEAAALIKRVMDYQESLHALRDDAKNEIELQDDVEVAASSKTVNVPVSVDTINKTVIFSNADETLTGLENGDILFIPPCDNIPNGLSGKVVSSSKGRNLKIKFEEPSLTEVIKSVDISTYVFADIDDYEDDGELMATSAVKGVKSTDNGFTVEGSTNADLDVAISWQGVEVYAGANIDKKASVHFETESYKKKEGIYAAVDLSMEAKVDIQIETDNFDITKFETSVNLFTDASAVGGYKNSISKEYSYDLPSCSIPVSGLFTINIDSSLVVQADGSLSVEATADLDNDMGIKFTINDGFTTYNTTNSSAGLSIDAEGSLKIGPKEKVELQFCSIEVMGKSLFEGVSLLEADASFGTGATGKTLINNDIAFSDAESDVYNSELKHMCWFCIEGDIITYFNGNVAVGDDIQSLISKFCDKKFSYNFADYENIISDWHLSTGEGYTLEFEMRKCPHYETVVSESDIEENIITISPGWYEADYTAEQKGQGMSYGLEIQEIVGSTVTFYVEYTGRNFSPLYTTDVITTVVEDNSAVFEWNDSWGNSGTGTMTFENSCIILSMTQTYTAEWNRSTLARDSIILYLEDENTAGLYENEFVETAKRALRVPESLDVTYKIWDSYYWDAGQRYLTQIDFYYNGQTVAGAAFDSDTYEIVRNILMYHEISDNPSN